MEQNLITFIVNPIAGGKDKSATVRKIRKFELRGNADKRILYSDNPEHGAELTLEEMKRNPKAIVAVGGDGTVNEVARCLIGTNIPLGIIPAGSGNGLARELGIPLNVSKAIENLDNFRLVNIDCGSLNGHPFFCASGVGFDAEVSRLFQENHQVRGLSSYIKISIQQLFKSKELPFKFIMNGSATLEKQAWFITVGNAKQFGNNAFICPQADMQDGKLNFAVVPKFSIPGLIIPAVQLFTKNIHKNSKVESGTAERIELTQTGEWAHIDGEPIKVGRELVYEVKKGALKVISGTNY